MQNITVLTPHARRMVVKVDGNKTLLWILEEVCRKYPQFEPNNYTLKRNNKPLDLTQHFRFSGIPNNCTLEMAETDKIRMEEDVVVCLQLEDGSRLNGSYNPTKTFYEIITEMCPEKFEGLENPVVIYMRTEVHGDALKSESLKSLGVSSGRVLLRLINSDPETLKVQANVSAPLPQKPKLEEPVEKPKSTSNADSGPSGAFQLKTIEQLIEKKVKFDEKMEVEEVTVEETAVKLPQAKSIETEPVIEQKSEIPPVINVLDKRGTIIFSLDSIQTSSVDLPDSFFELTEADVRVLYRELRQQVDENENAPLMTSELRKLEENKKILNQLATYKNCAIRIQLPNRYVIQTKFSTVETVGAVMEFIKEFLINPDVNFYLFLTPPKIVLEKELTLVEAKCVPSALLHFGTEEKITELLKPEVLAKLSSGSGASHVLLSSNSDAYEGEASTSEDLTAKPSVPKNLNFMESKSSSKPSGTIPKWFKPN